RLAGITLARARGRLLALPLVFLAGPGAAGAGAGPLAGAGAGPARYLAAASPRHTDRCRSEGLYESGHVGLRGEPTHQLSTSRLVRCLAKASSSRWFASVR